MCAIVNRKRPMKCAIKKGSFMNIMKWRTENPLQLQFPFKRGNNFIQTIVR